MSSPIKRSQGNAMKHLQSRFNKCTLVCSYSVWKIYKKIPINFANFLVKCYFMDKYFIISKTRNLIVSLQITHCNIYQAL